MPFKKALKKEYLLSKANILEQDIKISINLNDQRNKLINIISKIWWENENIIKKESIANSFYKSGISYLKMVQKMKNGIFQKKLIIIILFMMNLKIK